MSGVALILFGVMALVLSLGWLLHRQQMSLATSQELDTRLDSLTLSSFATSADTKAAPPPPQHVSVDAPRGLRIMMARADLKLQPSKLVVTAGIATAAVLIIARLLGPISALIALAVIIAGAFFLLKMIATRRADAFVNALPLFFDQIRNLITVGNSLSQAMVKATEGGGESLQRYLRPMTRRIQNGAPIGESLLLLSEKLAIQEMIIFATAIQTNLRYGGRLSNVLGNLAQLLRDAGRVKRELRAATAEVRLSGQILSGLPIGVALVIAFLNPTYMKFFIVTTSGHHLAALAIGLQVAGVLVMRRIMRLEF